MTFSGELLKRIRADLRKAGITNKDLKGIWIYSQKYGSRKNYEVQVPKNEKFVNGIYIHVGQAEDATDAKVQALRMLERNIENIDNIIKSGKVF